MVVICDVDSDRRSGLFALHVRGEQTRCLLPKSHGRQTFLSATTALTVFVTILVQTEISCEEKQIHDEISSPVKVSLFSRQYFIGLVLERGQHAVMLKQRCFHYSKRL